MLQNSHRRARAIAITMAERDRINRIAMFSLAATMSAACVYGFLAYFVF